MRIEMKRKSKPFTREWKKRAVELALFYAPEIQACVECNAPVARGYCCTSCGSGNGGISEGNYDPAKRPNGGIKACREAASP
jgi:hypothetical protein